jgi:16S rRNA (cytosine967-C5)-methyltransferase
MTPAARVQSAIDILDKVILATRDNGAPADAILSEWFKGHRFAGSKDKAAIRDIVWDTIRAYGNRPASGRSAILGTGRLDWEALFDGSSYGAAAVQPDEQRDVTGILPDWFAATQPDWLNDEEALALLGRAPLDVRINPLKSDLAAVAAVFPGSEPIAGLDLGLRLLPQTQFDQSELVRDGSIEVQDAGSQHVARIAGAQPGELVVDLCAGAGGKTLALAAGMDRQGRLIACDTNRARLSKLRPRAARAGVESIECRLLDPGREAEALADLAGQADLVLVDAPCSGTGTWRRSPDLRWRWTPDRLAAVEALQRHVIALGRSLLKPKGRLVYAVCSTRDEEGADQIAAAEGLVATLSQQPVGRPRGGGLLLTPWHDRTDGFFIASLSNSG